MYKITFNWDGKKPPTTFYNRLHGIGLRMVGAKELLLLRARPADTSPMSAHTWLGGEAWWTRGSVTCESESLAREVSVTAKYFGARVEQQEV